MLATEPQPETPASFTVPYGAGGRPTNVKLEGVPTDGVFTTFRRCVVTHGTERFAFDPIPEEAEVVIRAMLPAGP